MPAPPDETRPDPVPAGPVAAGPAITGPNGPVPLSLLDLAPIPRGGSAADSLATSVHLAQQAEARHLRRVWYAEHHNMAAIASSATAVLIAHVAVHTEWIRLGSGGVMLPNHSPLVVAEQFGTLATLHPGRIDLGLGRAPGTDRATLRALRRDPSVAERFPEDVVELQGYLSGPTRVPGVEAVPGRGTAVPLYILGSSLFGARLAALLGLPYAFASHFAPDALVQAVTEYRRSFRPSAQLAEPYVIVGVNVVVAASADEAADELRAALRQRAASLLGRGRELDDDEADALLASPAGAHVRHMATYSAVGTPGSVMADLAAFADHAGPDEIMVALPSPTAAGRLRSLDLLAAAAARVATPPH